MIVLKDKSASLASFLDLLQKTRERVLKLLSETKFPIEALDFEDLVYRQACESANGTEFEGLVERTGKHDFPDIIANQYFGIEVKTTQSDKWNSTGNSVLESTRREGIEKIFIFFAKLGGNPGIKFRPYHECLDDIVVTHSPRYRIDMELERGKSIFEKMGVTYDELRQEERPIFVVKDYYRRQLTDGESLWWIDEASDASASPVIRPYKKLPLAAKERLRFTGMILFPEIFGSSQLKFDRVAAYFLASRNVILSNFRDIYSASGKVTITIKKKRLRIPRVYWNLFQGAELIAKIIDQIEEKELLECWNLAERPKNVLDYWKKELNKITSKTKDGALLTEKGIKLSDVFEAGLTVT